MNKVILDILSLSFFLFFFLRSESIFINGMDLISYLCINQSHCGERAGLSIFDLLVLRASPSSIEKNEVRSPWAVIGRLIIRHHSCPTGKKRGNVSELHEPQLVGSLCRIYFGHWQHSLIGCHSQHSVNISTDVS